MYSDLIDSLAKIRALRHDATGMHFAFQGQPFTTVPLVAAHPPLATLLFINAVSVLDEAMKRYAHATLFLSEKKLKDMNLFHIIETLEKAGRLLDAGALHRLRDMRNECAHQVGHFVQWPILNAALDVIDAEFRHLGIAL